MKVVLFCHSLASCWNHGNAHFLRGVARELVARGHELRVLEPADGWSRTNLVAEQGIAALAAWREAYPELETMAWRGLPELDAVLDGADLVLVHEWSSTQLVRAIGRRKAHGAPFVLLFHDTHHRAVTSPGAIGGDLLDGYDGVLAFGACLRERYLEGGWSERVWVWHEAADIAHFRPHPETEKSVDLVWIGNWGDGERGVELRQFLVEPVAQLGLRSSVHGVRYPETALAELAAAGIRHRGWLPNHQVPAAFSSARVTVHVPRRPYTEALPGIPTIRVFEALACGIPLVCAPWRDSEGLFPADAFLHAADGEEMTRQLRAVLADADLRRHLVASGLAAIRARHTCAHRVDELLAIHDMIRGEGEWERRECA